MSKIRCLWTQLNFIGGLIEFIEGLISTKFNFLSQFGLNRKKLKFKGQLQFLRVDLVRSGD